MSGRHVARSGQRTARTTTPDPAIAHGQLPVGYVVGQMLTVHSRREAATGGIDVAQTYAETMPEVRNAAVKLQWEKCLLCGYPTAAQVGAEDVTEYPCPNCRATQETDR